ncbi:uracil-DNA glycosylase [Chitinilyticum aquatile]|uniref:uracil-DNA glycosylase n=1 Tax=Chitinilyticum aquatile TaxID=362520 RepID=UPI0004022A6E|nr:uracil-DNA glycosylase [Chitinilyticum aquatile]
MSMTVPAAWQPLLADYLANPAWLRLQSFLESETAAGKTIYPPQAQRLAALEALAPEDVRVVILGQDPYHGAGEAHGLSFSVPHGVRMPPSLRNIWQEIARDLGVTPPQHGNLAGWARQGVLLLNSVLTVEADCAASHAKKGWEGFTDCLIEQLAARHPNLVFMLWGSHAHKKAARIEGDRHLLLKSAHPSPLSAYRGFIGNGHFSAANDYLRANSRTPINWEDV